MRGSAGRNGGVAGGPPAETAPTQPEALVLENVNWLPGSEQSWIAVSATGTAVSVPGNPDRRHLVWGDRQGQVTQLPGEPDQITHASLSPAGPRVVYNGPNSQSAKHLLTRPSPRLLSYRTTLT